MLKRLITLALISLPVNAGFVDVKNNEIRLKYKADGFMLAATRSGEFDRYGLGYGHKGKHYEVYYGLHDNLKPYAHGLYMVPDLRVQFDLSIESKPNELERGYDLGFGVSYFTSEKWAVLVSVDGETFNYGFRKVF